MKWDEYEQAVALQEATNALISLGSGESEEWDKLWDAWADALLDYWLAARDDLG